jgi:hypothetical protein
VFDVATEATEVCGGGIDGCGIAIGDGDVVVATTTGEEEFSDGLADLADTENEDAMGGVWHGRGG